MKKAYTLQVIGLKHPYYDDCMELCTITKQLYNVGLYELRQTLIHQQSFLSYKAVYQLMKSNENWCAIPRKVSNQVWKQVTGSWSSWLKGLKRYKQSPRDFMGRPKMPNYNTSLNSVVYEKGALGTRGLPTDHIRLSQTNIILDISTIKGDVVEARITPRKNKFIIRVTYTEEMKQTPLNYDKIAGIDLGLNNLIAVATNQADIPHIMVNGRGLKSINHYGNKQVAKRRSKLAKGSRSSLFIRNVQDKRNQKVADYLHKASRTVVDWLVENAIGTLIIGKNKHWKTAIKMGKRNNQNFVQIPHARLIDLIQYKFEQENGIVVVHEESYTSKASALDLDPLPTYRKKGKKRCFSGRRIKRGLYKTLKGLLINADINGALNIIRKVAKNSLDDLVEDTQFIHHCATPRFI
jgi:IS605 OrfB family transposase